MVILTSLIIRLVQEKMSTPNHRQGVLEQIDSNTNQVDTAIVNIHLSDDTRARDLELSLDHDKMGATPCNVSPQLKVQRAKEVQGVPLTLIIRDHPMTSPNSQVLWHPSDLSVKPVEPSRKADKASIPCLLFDTLPVSDFVKMPLDQLEAVSNRIVAFLDGKTTNGEKQNVSR